MLCMVKTRVLTEKKQGDTHFLSEISKSIKIPYNLFKTKNTAVTDPSGTSVL